MALRLPKPNGEWPEFYPSGRSRPGRGPREGDLRHRPSHPTFPQLASTSAPFQAQSVSSRRGRCQPMFHVLVPISVVLLIWHIFFVPLPSQASSHTFSNIKVIDAGNLTEMRRLIESTSSTLYVAARRFNQTIGSTQRAESSLDDGIRALESLNAHIVHSASHEMKWLLDEENCSHFLAVRASILTAQESSYEISGSLIACHAVLNTTISQIKAAGEACRSNRQGVIIRCKGKMNIINNKCTETAAHVGDLEECHKSFKNSTRTFEAIQPLLKSEGYRYRRFGDQLQPVLDKLPEEPPALQPLEDQATESRCSPDDVKFIERTWSGAVFGIIDELRRPVYFKHYRTAGY